jgi:tetratricopeptide (TPR) repeat protein
LVRLWQAIRERPGRALLVAVLLGIILFTLGLAGVFVWGEYHYRAAKTALENDEFDAARQHVAHCLDLWPNNAEVHLLAARIARRSSEPRMTKVVEKHLLRCETILGGTPQEVWLEWALLRTQNGEVAAFEDTLREMIKQEDPHTDQILEGLARGYQYTHQFDKSIETLDQLIQRRPNSSRAFLWRGAARERIHNTEGALADYRHAVELNPQDKLARLALAEALVQNNVPSEALPHFQKLRQSGFKHPAILLGMARCRISQGQFKEARTLLDTLLRDEPNNRFALSERGQLALKTEDPKQAETDLRKALDLNPRDYQTLFSYHRCLEQLGKKEEARKLEKELKQQQADLQRLNELIKYGDLNSPPAALCYDLGCLFLRTGQTEMGLFWLQRALNTDPLHRETHEVLAQYFDRTHQPERAALHRKLAKVP